MRVPKAGCQGRTRRARGQRPGIVLGRVITPGGDRETGNTRRGPSTPTMRIPVLYARTRDDRFASRERANRPPRVSQVPAGGHRVGDQVGIRVPFAAIYFSVLATSGAIAATPTIMLVLHGLLVIAGCRVIAAMPSAPVKAVYDQRQTGDLNVQIELKDLQVIALLNSELLDDYTDYDYFYDYADFTAKPGRPTTSSTTETTEKNDVVQFLESFSSPNSTVSASVDNTSPPTSNATLSKDEGVPYADPSSGTASSTTLSKDEEIPTADPLNGTASSTADSDKGQPSEEENGAGIAPSTTVKPVHAPRSQKRCKSGYVPNGDGRCRRASRPWLTRLLP